MKKILLLDFNRTLWDPDKEVLHSGVFELLDWLTADHWDVHLVSKGDDSCYGLLEALGLDKYFKTRQMVGKKTIALFEGYVEDSALMVALGDRAREELFCAWSVGMSTIWYRNGKFKDESPLSDDQVIDFQVRNLIDVIPLLKNMK